MNGGRVGRIQLRRGLLNGDGGAGGIIGDGVVRAGGGGVAVPQPIRGGVGEHGGDDGAITCHATDGDGVGGAIIGRNLGDGARGRPCGATEGHVARGKITDGFVEDRSEIDRGGVGWIQLPVGLVNGDGGPSGIRGV